MRFRRPSYRSSLTSFRRWLLGVATVRGGGANTSPRKQFLAGWQDFVEIQLSPWLSSRRPGISEQLFIRAVTGTGCGHSVRADPRNSFENLWCPWFHVRLGARVDGCCDREGRSRQNLTTQGIGMRDCNTSWRSSCHVRVAFYNGRYWERLRSPCPSRSAQFIREIMVSLVPRAIRGEGWLRKGGEVARKPHRVRNSEAGYPDLGEI